MDYQPLDEVYTPKYCLQLEAAYGKGMMSDHTGIFTDEVVNF